MRTPSFTLVRLQRARVLKGRVVTGGRELWGVFPIDQDGTGEGSSTAKARKRNGQGPCSSKARKMIDQGLSTPKTRKMNGQGLRSQKLARWLNRKSPPLPNPLRIMGLRGKGEWSLRQEFTIPLSWGTWIKLFPFEFSTPPPAHKKKRTDKELPR